MPGDGARFRCGYVAIVGRPNVGKSTLLNRILGQKLSITSRKPQTTRHRILGIKTGEGAQAIYVDTPGLHSRSERALHRYMNRAASSAMRDVDVILLVADARGWTEDDEVVLARAPRGEVPCVLVLNKIDRLEHRSELLPLIERLSAHTGCEEIVPLSALRGDNLDRLESVVRGLLPEGEAMFPEDQVTDRSERFVAGEIIREKLIERLGQEVPHRLSVEIERFEETSGRIDIGAIVWVEREGQKAIVIGAQGRLLKAAGTDARIELERMLNGRVNLKLWAKVKRGWSDSERALRELGYE